ncbi:MAG: CBS-domain-containing membrane protein [Sulfurimonas sp.]|jgi:CBS-domain-containing membrane protein|uniref:HPP family protein n=1 Tax=Sulfurimonas sp. TaxID=2022749 RepID=UPI0039E4A67D
MNMLHKMITFTQRMKGYEKAPKRKHFSEVIWSWIGAFLGIYLVSILSKSAGITSTDGLFLIGSFGASAVLIYAAPQLDFSQPRNFLGGQALSAPSF